jgi:hypothetical protein
MPKDLKLSVREDGKINTFTTEELFGGETLIPKSHTPNAFTTEELFGGAFEHHRRLLSMLLTCLHLVNPFLCLTSALTMNHRQRPNHEMLAGKKSVVFAVPGAFTPTCSEQHLPSFVKLNEVLSSV